MKSIAILPGCIRVRSRRFGWALSLTLGLDPRRFAWKHHRNLDVGFGPSGAWAFGVGILTYIRLGAT